MTNTNRKYLNGLRKRKAVRAVASELERRGAFEPQPERLVCKRLAWRPHFIIDTNVMFGLIEYWADDLRAHLRRLVDAQPSLRLFLLDVVATECRGSLEKRSRYEEVVFNGRNERRAFVHPLSSQTSRISQLASSLVRDRQAEKPSDLKDRLIASAAVEYDMAVLTCNMADFERLRIQQSQLRFVGLGEGGHEGAILMGSRILHYLGELYARPSALVGPVGETTHVAGDR